MKSMRCIEYRIPMPLSLEEYEVGSTYAYLRSIEEQLGTGAGVELLERREFEEEEPEDGRMEAGVYRRKKNQFGQHLPTILSSLAPEGSLYVVEESWDCFPFKKSVFKSPYLGAAFHIEVRQMILDDDRGEHPNALDLDPVYLDRPIEYIDIFSDDKTGSPLEGPGDIALFRSEKHGRGPLKEDFHVDHDPICTVYSAVFIRLDTPVLQETAENLLLSWGVRDMLLAIHRRTVMCLDEWKDIHDNDSMLEYEDRVLKPQ